MELQSRIAVEPGERFVRDTREVVERTMRTESEITLHGPCRVLCYLPRFVHWRDAFFSVQKLVNGEWVFGSPNSEAYKDPDFKKRPGEFCGREVAFDSAGQYKIIHEWKTLNNRFMDAPPTPVVLSIAGRHPTLKAFNIVELGGAHLFDKFDPRWLMYGQYAYLVQLNIPKEFADNTHIHFGTMFDILLNTSKESLSTWLNVHACGATLLVWDKHSLDILLGACAMTITGGNELHRVDAEVTALVRPEASWSNGHD